MSTRVRIKETGVNDMPLDEAYFTWLYSQVGSVKNRNLAKTYWNLLKLLYKREFVWSVDMDANRAHDGRDLRVEFLRENNSTKPDPDWIALECSVLEMMIALSRKLAFVGEGEPRDWFWELIENLGLIECTDAVTFEEGIINHIIDLMLNREYAPNGAGGLFPLSEAEQDQRDVELWYQAQAYLLERL